MEYYSQLGQDKQIIQYYPNRYFVEVGAGDGKSLSNTLTLEKYLGWSGICIEPIPTEFEKLKANRKCHCVNSAVYSQDGLIFDFSITKNPLLSGINRHLDFNRDGISKTIILKTRTLTSILDEYSAPKFIEYISIDVQGSELEVLKGIDWEKYSFGYLSVEHNYRKPQRSEIRDYLTKRGYRFYRENQWDDDYVLA